MDMESHAKMTEGVTMCSPWRAEFVFCCDVQIFLAALLAVGLSVFARGDTGDLSESPASSWLGVLLILGAVLADAFTANFEEKHFFRLPEPAR
jgi:hypothetical protein